MDVLDDLRENHLQMGHCLLPRCRRVYGYFSRGHYKGEVYRGSIDVPNFGVRQSRRSSVAKAGLRTENSHGFPLGAMHGVKIGVTPKLWPFKRKKYDEQVDLGV